ncbi:hypothetical protein ALP42_05571 [Pseudomonas savastanoi pv. nerii]|uniref:Uncharacterized protein n=1 Tax=Pseudomonas savastanoi pv. nerii TaxID=360921 RepID=A0AB74BE58_PSESS|nr:hypothetical protein ALP42_05571 [Pseudomonas savastanoi pv. nerii]
MHGVFHACQPLLAGTGENRRLVCCGGDFGHGSHQVARGGSNFPRGRADLGGGCRGLGSGGLLLAGSRSDFSDRSRYLHRRTLGLRNQRSQLGHHVVEAGFDRIELVLAGQVQAGAQISGTHDVQNPHDQLHRCHDRTHQQQPAGRSRQHCHQQRQDHADLGSQHGVDNVGGGLISQLFIGHDEIIELLAAREPDRVHFAIEFGARACVVAAIVLAVNIGEHARIGFAALFEKREAVSVCIIEDGLLVAVHLCLQVFVKPLKLVLFLLGQRTPLPFGNQLQGADVTFAPCAAHQRAVVDTG